MKIKVFLTCFSCGFREEQHTGGDWTSWSFNLESYYDLYCSKCGDSLWRLDIELVRIDIPGEGNK
jgi:hypothetical protein